MKNFSQNNQIPLSSSQNLSNIHRKIRKSIQLNQNNINPKQDPNIAQYHQKLVRKNTVNCTFELEKPKQPSITTTNNFYGGNQKNDGEEEIIIQTAGDLVAASTLKKKYAIKMKTYGQEFNEEIEFNEKARQQQVNLEDWENNQQSKKNEDEILKKKEQKLQQKELEEVNIPKINQAIIDSVLGKIENRVPNIKNIEDIEEQIQANHVLKPRTFNYTQQQMFEGETQLPSDIAEIILTHFYPNKKFEDMERVKRKTLKRIVKSMVSIRMEKVINKVGFQSINDQQTLFNIGKFVAISTLKNFSQLKATKIVDNIDYNYLGKKINDNQRQLKRLFNFTDDEKTPRLSFKRNEKQILKQYQDCLQEITLKEEILTDLRIEQSYQQQEVNEINNKIVQKKRDILDPIVGLEMGKKENKKNQNQMQQQSHQMIKSPNSTDENTDIFKFQNNNNNFIDLTDAKQFLKSNTKAIQYSMMSPLQQEFENEFQKYLNKGKIIKEAQEDLRILEKEKEEKYSVLKAQMEKIQVHENQYEQLVLQKEKFVSFLKDRYIDLLLNDYKNAQNMTIENYKYNMFMKISYIIQQIRYLGEEVRPEYFPDFIDDESIKYFTKIAEINQQINDKYDILKQIENQMKKKNQLRSKNPQEVKKSILKFNKDDIKQRLLSLQAGKIKAEIPESNLLYAKKSGQQLYLGELNEFYESQSKLIQLQAKTPSFNPFSEITKSVDEIELSISQKYKEIKKLQQEETQRIQKKFKDADEAFDEDEAINSCHKMLNIILGPKEGSREFFKYKQDLIAKKLRKQENETYYFSSTLNKNIKKKQAMQDDKSEEINTQFYNQVRKNKEIEILQKQTQKKMKAFQSSNDPYEVQNLDFKAAQNFLMEQLNSKQNYKSANNIKILKYQEVDPNYIQDYDLKNNYKQDYDMQQGNQIQQNQNKHLPKQLPNRFKQTSSQLKQKIQQENQMQPQLSQQINTMNQSKSSVLSRSVIKSPQNSQLLQNTIQNRNQDIQNIYKPQSNNQPFIFSQKNKQEITLQKQNQPQNTESILNRSKKSILSNSQSQTNFYKSALNNFGQNNNNSLYINKNLGNNNICSNNGNSIGTQFPRPLLTSSYLNRGNKYFKENYFSPCQNTAFSETRSGLNSSQSICRPKTQQTYQRKKNVHFEEEEQSCSGEKQRKFFASQREKNESQIQLIGGSQGSLIKLSKSQKNATLENSFRNNFASNNQLFSEDFKHQNNYTFNVFDNQNDINKDNKIQCDDNNQISKKFKKKLELQNDDVDAQLDLLSENLNKGYRNSIQNQKHINYRGSGIAVKNA